MEDDLNDRMPAWIMAQDLLTKLKYEFTNRAMAVLEKEIKEGRINFNGKLVLNEDKNKENEEYMFMINHLVEDKEKIHKQYDDHIKELEDSDDPTKVKISEGLKKFLLAIDTISMLIDYSKALDDWILDASLSINEDNPSNILAYTVNNDPIRKEIVNFCLTNPYFKDEILTNDETKLLKEADEQSDINIG